MRNLHSQQTRRGAITVLAALLLTFLLGMVAFAVDISWIVLTRAELQNTADSAALAGVQQMMDNLPLFYDGNATAAQKNTLANAAMTAARTKARAMAAANTAGGVSNLNLLDGDMIFGYTDSTGTFTQYSSASANHPNTMKVTVRRDGTANTTLGLFFAPVLGSTSTSLTANATAVLYSGTVDSFLPTAIGGVLPMTYDETYWNNFVATGQNPDGAISTDASGNPQIKVYPSIKATGNFGLLSLDDSSNSASTIRRWIDSGMTSSEVTSISSDGLIPLSSHDATAWDWKGAPGMKASDVMAVNDHTGDTYLMPLFKAYNSDPTNYAAGTGNGSHYDYNIVSFVAVRIQATTDTNGSVIVQPAAKIVEGDVTWLSGSLKPAGSGTTRGATTFSTPKLTQ
ncbi:MAG: pilus assembly protein TadG-related protein [Gemmataceae bacterium]